MRRVAVTLGAHHGDLVTGADECLALEPHPAVERDGQVLDDDEDAFHQPTPW
jgi:hypothetical protein